RATFRLIWQNTRPRFVIIVRSSTEYRVSQSIASKTVSAGRSHGAEAFASASTRVAAQAVTLCWKLKPPVAAAPPPAGRERLFAAWTFLVAVVRRRGFDLLY